MKLTDYQAGQLLYIHFEGEFKYRTDSGTRVPSAQWRKMIDVLCKGGYVAANRNGFYLTPKGREYIDANHMNIKPLS
jgi:ribosomal protein S19E (S16A)